MNDIASLTDHAAAQGDRWLFVFVFLFLLATFGLFFRWLLKDREAMSKRLTEVTDRHIEQSAKLAEVVTNNTNAFNASVNAYNQLTQELRHGH